MRNKAQSSIEFTLAFVCTILFIVLTCNLFVWFNHCLSRRQVSYENSREAATQDRNNPGKYDFTPPELNVFSLGGRN